MENVIANLESKVAPAAVAAGTPAGLNVGHINYGKELFDLYAREDANDTMVKTIIRMADALAVDQFAKEVGKAQEIATATDAALGWKAPEGAKGAELYGPKRRLINSRMSEAKQIFGVQKVKPEILKEKGYWAAVQAARDYLNNEGIKWDGQKKLNAEQRAVKKQNKESNEAVEIAKNELPQQPGESIESWMIRCARKAEQIKLDMKIERVGEKVDKLVEDEGNDAVIEAMFEYIKKQGKEAMHNFAQRLHEEASEMKEVEAAPL